MKRSVSTILIRWQLREWFHDKGSQETACSSGSWDKQGLLYVGELLLPQPPFVSMGAEGAFNTQMQLDI